MCIFIYGTTPSQIIHLKKSKNDKNLSFNSGFLYVLDAQLPIRRDY